MASTSSTDAIQSSTPEPAAPLITEASPPALSLTDPCCGGCGCPRAQKSAEAACPLHFTVHDLVVIDNIIMRGAHAGLFAHNEFLELGLLLQRINNAVTHLQTQTQ